MTARDVSPGSGLEADESPRDRIRRAAMELYAERGQRGPTLRAVGERADVSPGLVQHHYKTTQRLLEEVESWVVDQLAEVASGAATGIAAIGVDPARYDALLVGDPVLAGYLRRRLLESSESVVAGWLEAGVAHRRNDVAADGTNGFDTEVTAAMAALVAIAPVLLGPLLEFALDTDTERLRTSWRAVETAVLGLAFEHDD